MRKKNGKTTSTAPVRTAPAEHPIAVVKWVDPKKLHSNSYNPNRVFKLELELLKRSILEDGWTQPIVVRPDMEIVDGFHRWTLGSTDPEVAAVAGGLIPVVILPVSDPVRQMASTVRHNRARGQHGILKMGEIVRAAQERGATEDQICEQFGMEPEEVDRLADIRSSPEHAGKDSFGMGWVPSPVAPTKPTA